MGQAGPSAAHTARSRRIGLFGGSFNPPHEGHRHASVMAMTRLALDEVWWLVTPGNPLKDKAGLADFRRRREAAGAVAAHPRIRVSAFEYERGLTYTYDTLRAMVGAHPATAFVWIMGADNLADIHRWQHWEAIFALLPVAVIDRPGYRYRALAARSASRFSACRVDEEDAPLLAGLAPPAWCFLTGPLNTASSTSLRRDGNGLQEPDTGRG